MKRQGEQLAIEELERRILEVEMAWILKKGIVRVMDRVIESTEFTLGVRKMKASCVVASVEGGKQAVRE